MPVRRDKTGRWRYRKVVRLPDGSKLRISGCSSLNTKEETERAERDHVLRTLKHGGKRKESPPLRVFEKEYMRVYAHANNKPSAVESKRSLLEHHIVPVLGHLALDKIGPREIEHLKSACLGKELSPKTVNNALTVLRKLLSVAFDWQLLDHVPAIRWLRCPKPEFEFLTFEEAERLAATTSGQWRCMITTALKTGLRQGELLGLKWGDVDLAAGRLVVRRAAVRGIIGTPKNGRTREIPLSREALSALKAHRHARSELVYCGAEGQLLTRGQCRNALSRACKRACLRPVGWHALRHTFASHLAMRGAPLKAVQELMGHASIEMTMRYAHLSPDVRRDVVRLLDREDG